MGKRYTGVREVGSGIYEINYQADGIRKQHRIKAASEKDAYKERCRRIANREASVNKELADRTQAEFRIGYRSLREKLKARNLPHKTILHYKKTYYRIFYEFRRAKHPSVKTFAQLNSIYFEELESFVVNVLGLKWRGEKTFIDTIIKKLNDLGYITDEHLIKKIKEMKKPPQEQKDFPNIHDNDLEALLKVIAEERPDYHRACQFMKKTGRRIEETTLYEKGDLVWSENRLVPIRINVRPITSKIKYKKLPVETISEPLAELILDSLQNRKKSEAPYLFLNRHGRKISQGRLCDYLKEKSKEMLGVEITPHYFRHRFMTICASSGISMKDAMAIAGISDTETALKYYSHSTEDGRKKALDIS